MPLILGTNSIKDTGYDVANSLRFNDGSSDYLDRTPSSAGNRKTFTFATWFKLGSIDTTKYFISSYSASSDSGYTHFSVQNNNKLHFAGNTTDFRTSTQLLRDPSAWYHVVLAVDTTQATASDRIKIYLNGSQITDFTNNNNPNQNDDFAFNQNAIDMVVGSANAGGSKGAYWDGYLAETVWIDGQALDPTSFGEFDEDTGIWKPIDVSGLTFGNNGFYLDFENSGSLGADVSGNGNNFTVNNLTSIDQSTDTCTNNFSTLSPLYPNTQYGTFSDGNNTVVGNSSSNASTNNSTLAPSQGKWYMEYKIIQVRNTSYPSVGMIGSEDASNNIQVGTSSNSVSYRAGGTILIGGSITATENSYTDNDIISVAMDLDNGAVYFAKNNDYQNNGVPTSGSSRTGSLYNFTPSDFYHFSSSVYQSDSSISANFGSPSYTISSGNTDGNGYGNFEYAVPSGYYALNTKNLAEYG